MFSTRSTHGGVQPPVPHGCEKWTAKIMMRMIPSQKLGTEMPASAAMRAV